MQFCWSTEASLLCPGNLLLWTMGKKSAGQKASKRNQERSARNSEAHKAKLANKAAVSESRQAYEEVQKRHFEGPPVVLAPGGPNFGPICPSPGERAVRLRKALEAEAADMEARKAKAAAEDWPQQAGSLGSLHFQGSPASRRQCLIALG